MRKNQDTDTHTLTQLRITTRHTQMKNQTTMVNLLASIAECNLITEITVKITPGTFTMKMIRLKF